MDLHQLRGFYEIVREQSFTRAADKRFLTQPAISLQLKALEEELGESLVERDRRRIRLTPAGEILFRRAEEIFARLEEARDEIAGLRDVLRGRLAVGTSDTNCTYVLPGALQAFREQHPQVELDIRNRMSPEVVRLVLDSEVDFGLVTMPVRQRGLDAEKLFVRRDVLICPADHPLAGRRQVRLEEVADHPLLALERGSTSRQLMDDAFLRAGLMPEVVMDLGGIEVIKRFVEIGLGVALVPQVAIREEVAAGRLAAARVRDLAPREIGLIERRGRRRTPAQAAFVQMLRHRLARRSL